jgi:hypothetical protein
VDRVRRDGSWSGNSALPLSTGDSGYGGGFEGSFKLLGVDRVG